MELLIEGLPGAAELCENYRFHVERGFGVAYKTNVSRLSAPALNHCVCNSYFCIEFYSN